MAEMIVTRAPTRIDFGGGWTDVPPYSDEMGGYVCNVAIDRYATVTVRLEDSAERGGATPPDRDIANAALRRFRLPHAQLTVKSDFPIGAGLGGSSAAGVATVAALAAASDRTMTRDAMAELSREIEIADLGIAGGRQDHYAAAFGGALGLRFGDGAVEVHHLPLPDGVRAELERRCLIVYTGQSRISGDTIDAVLGAYRAGDRTVLDALSRMKQLAEEMAAVLSRGDIDSLCALVGEQWTHQRSLHPAIPTPLIDEIIARGREAGALGAKALGASGGGCVLVMARADRVEEVRAAIAPLGELLAFGIDQAGVKQCV